MAPRKLRTTLKSEAEATADKYISKKGAKPKDVADKPAEDYELSDAAFAKSEHRPPEVRIIRARPNAPKITEKELLFIEHYTGDCSYNGAEAARQAGYAAKNARHTAYELLTKPHIRTAVEVSRRERLRRVEFNADALLKSLISEHYADLAEIYNEDNTLKPIHEWPIEFRMGLITGIETEEIFAGSGADRIKVGEVQKVKTTDRIAVKRMLGQHLSVQAFRRFAGIDDKPEASLADELRKLTEGTGLRPREIDGTARHVAPAVAPETGIRPVER